jgi:hypothetical protein
LVFGAVLSNPEGNQRIFRCVGFRFNGRRSRRRFGFLEAATRSVRARSSGVRKSFDLLDHVRELRVEMDEVGGSADDPSRIARH